MLHVPYLLLGSSPLVHWPFKLFFPTSSLQQTPLQVHAVEREKLSSFLLSVKASGRMLRDEATILLCALFQGEHLPGQEESVTTLPPGHWGSGPEGQVSFESFLSFLPVHD